MQSLTWMRPATAERHVRAFDGLRGIAIVLVLLYHVGEDVPARALGGIVEAALYSGWLGVDVFFVLSGFLITGILLDARGDGPEPNAGYFQRFYARRALRIFPLYYLFLAVTILIAHPPMPHGTWWYWTYTSNVLVARYGWPDGRWETGHLWSLAVEEQFYLVWPAIIAWMPRRRLPVLCTVVIVAAIAMRVAFIHQGAPHSAYVLTPARADTLAIGAALAIALRSGPRVKDTIARLAPTISAVLIIALGALFVTHNLDHRLTIGGLVFGSLATSLLTAATIARVETPWVRRALEWGPLVSFGTYSYAIYIVQLPLRGGIDAWLGGRLAALPPWAAVAVELALLTGGSWGIAWVTWRLIERPMLSLKRYVPMPRQEAGAVYPTASAPINGLFVK